MSCTITYADHLPPINSGPFSYDTKNGFQLNDIPRSSLQSLFTPKHGKPLTESPGYKLTKKGIETQLRLYGHPCTGIKRMKVGQMREFLHELFKSGKLSSPSEEITAIENDLKDRYVALNTAHITAIIQSRQADFDKITDPTKAAEASIPLFLRRYFLNDDGTPNRAKSKEPVVLPRFENRGAIYAAAERISGLHTHSDGPEPYRVLAIGWDRGEVWNAAQKAAQVGYRQKSKEEEGKKKMRMDMHRRFVKNLKADKRKSGNEEESGDEDEFGEAEESGQEEESGEEDEFGEEEFGEEEEFGDEEPENQESENEGSENEHTEERQADFNGLKEAVGRYLVLCDGIEKEWPDCSRNGLWMKIVKDSENPGRMIASFDFGILEGVMRFTRDGEAPLPEKKKSWEEDGLDSEDEMNSGSELEYDSSIEEEEEEYISPGDSNKRKRTMATAIKSTNPNSGSTWSAPQAKKPRTDAIDDSRRPHSNGKLNFLWRGRDTSQYEIQLDFNQSNKGFIQFGSSDCVTFTGIMHASFAGKVNLKGYKVAKDDGRNIRNEWEDYSEEAYERARVARWR